MPEVKKKLTPEQEEQLCQALAPMQISQTKMVERKKELVKKLNRIKE